MNLSKTYEIQKEIYNKTKNKKELLEPAELLALLLLQEQENYLPLLVTEGEFYNYYQSQIDSKINQVITDFQFTKQEIENYIEQTIINEEEKYEENKIWFVFAEGFGALHWGRMYRKNNSPEDIFQEYFDKDLTKITPPIIPKKKVKAKNK